MSIITRITRWICILTTYSVTQITTYSNLHNNRIGHAEFNCKYHRKFQIMILILTSISIIIIIATSIYISIIIIQTHLISPMTSKAHIHTSAYIEAASTDSITIC